MIERLLDAFAPHRCCSCGEIGLILCERCKENISAEPFSQCVFCTKPTSGDNLCANCRRKLPFEQFWCVGEREGALKCLGDAYKFDCKRAAAPQLADLLDTTLPLLTFLTVIVAIPSSTSSVRRRGFDHVGGFVKKLARLRGLKTAVLLERNKDVTLHLLPRKDREKYAEDLFVRTTNPVPDTVLLVDDILTTGTTMLAAAKLLKEAGVEHLYGAVVARQPRK